MLADATAAYKSVNICEIEFTRYNAHKVIGQPRDLKPVMKPNNDNVPVVGDVGGGRFVCPRTGATTGGLGDVAVWGTDFTNLRQTARNILVPNRSSKPGSTDGPRCVSV
jgi:hypothetical protein